ncbi:MAG: radical SAM protein [Clostridium sp.]
MNYLNLKLLQPCVVCPRQCMINRLENKIGFCKSTDKVKIALVSLHHWEEPCISGEEGSGTIFFSGCNLNCVFCQNHDISQEGIGYEVTIEELSDIFIEQESKGANNINLVTPTHYAPQIIEAITLAKKKGLSLPILYNCNGYESLETLNLLRGYIDVFLPDLKYFKDNYAIKYSKAPNYFKIASAAIEKMYAIVGVPKFNKKGIIEKGVIIRHLMLPGLLFDSKKIIDYIYKTFGDNVYISLMNQYTPMFKVKTHDEYKEINKTLNPKHYDSLIDYCLELGITKAFIQDHGTNTESYVPKFK